MSPPSSGSASPTMFAKLVKYVLSAMPWIIIAVLLWAGIFIKPQPVGTTVEPPVIERSDAYYGLVSPEKGVIWAVGNNGKIIRSADTGATWVKQVSGTPAHLQDIAAWDSKRAVAVGNGGVALITADGGASWQSVETPRSAISNKLLRVVALPNGEAWSVGELGALIHSGDFGKTWERRHGEEDTGWNGIAFQDEKRGWVVGEAGKMLKTNDGGHTWDVVPPVVKSSLMAIAFRDADNGVIVGLEGVTLTTRDGGKTWQQVAVAKAGAAEGVSSKQHLYDVSWDASRSQWFAVGDQGVWAHAEKEVHAWVSGHLGEHELAWHTRVVAAGGQLFLAGATVGEWGGKEASWKPFGAK